MMHYHFTPDIKAPEGAVCYQCGAKAVTQCSCCDNYMCLRHTVPFVSPDQKRAITDYVECQSCDEQQDELGIVAK